MSKTKKFNFRKHFNKNTIVPVVFSLFSIIFVSYILTSTVEYYLVKYIF
jgi:hypothetical protein